MFSYPIGQKLPHFVALTRLNRPIGIYLLLWPTLWGLWFAANGIPQLHILLIFVIGTILTRSAGCAINDFADRKIDAHVQRTRDRPLATGALSATEALIAAAILMALAFLLVLFTNSLTIYMSVVALFLAGLYPFTKRVTHWPQVFLGLAFAFAIPMAFAAQTNSVPTEAWWLFTAAVIMAMAYDTLYAMADREFDIQLGMKSTAILFGKHELLAVALLQLLVLIILVGVGMDQQRGSVYYAGLLGAALLFAYQHWLCREREPARCIQAFLNNHYVGLIIFIALVIDYATGTG